MTIRGKLNDTLAAMFSNPDYRDSYLFYAHIIGQCSIKIDDELPAPAGVAFIDDHYNLYINPNEFDKFSLNERLAILKHEALHILYGHVTSRGAGLDSMLWNISADCALNQHIDYRHLPDCAITPDTIKEQIGVRVPDNLSSEFYYNFLKENARKNSGTSSNTGTSGNPGTGSPSPQSSKQPKGQGEPRLLDTHKTWEQSTGDGDLQRDMNKRMIERAQSETIKGRGNIPSACSKWLELHSRSNEVNWKKVLRGIIGNRRVGVRSTIMRSDRRFPLRNDLRGKTRDRTFNLLVIADVSGSMSSDAILSTLNEVRNVCDVTKTDVNLIQIDTVAYEPEKLTKNTTCVTRRGNGGTYLYPAVEKAKEHGFDFQAIVVLTDGGLSKTDIDKFNDLGKKVIWLIEPNGIVCDGMNTKRMRAFKLRS